MCISPFILVFDKSCHVSEPYAIITFWLYLFMIQLITVRLLPKCFKQQ